MAEEPDWQIDRVSCFEWVRRLDVGATRPAIVTATWHGADRAVFLKFRDPRRIRGSFGPASLACELVGAAVARQLGLPTPVFGIVDVPSFLAEDAVDPAARDILESNIGPNFGTVHVEGAVTFRASSKARVDIQTLSEVMAFDVVLHNKDRSIERPNLLLRDTSLFLIDHGLCPPLDALHGGVDASSIWMTDLEAREHIARSIVRKADVSPEKLLDRWENAISEAALDSLRTEIPAEWDDPPGMLALLFEFLADRSSLFRTTLCRVIEKALL